MTGRDWTLLVLAAAGGRPLTPAQLQKVLFLMGKKGKVRGGFYNFRPYNFGPFTAEIYQDADSLERDGLARIDRKEPGRPWALYSATADGIQAADRMSVDSQTREYAERLVDWARGLSFQQLVSAVYREFPEQRANSIFIE